MKRATGGSRLGAAQAWRCADLGGLELFQASISQFEFRPHAHEEFFIALTEAGFASPAYRGDVHAIGPGDMIVLNPEEAHAGGPAAGGSWAYRALYPSAGLMRQVAAELPGRTSATPWFTGDVIADPAVATLLRRFHELSQDRGTSALQREACLVRGLLLLASRHAARPRAPGAPGSEPQAVRLASEYLHEHATDDVTLQDLAACTGLSPYRLCRVFRQATGLTPHSYQVQARVRRAKQLLLAGRPVAQVAAETGFCDQAHFTRQFKRTVGIPPAAYVAGLTT